MVRMFIRQTRTNNSATGEEYLTFRLVLKSQSALGELIDVDWCDFSHINLYRASDVLMKYRQDIENHVFNAVTSLFGLEETVTLYDLTNFMYAKAQKPSRNWWGFTKRWALMLSPAEPKNWSFEMK